MSAKLTIDQLKQHPSFTTLTSRQQQMVLGFLETGNKFKAVKAAYRANDSSARSMACTYFSKPNIVECLNVASGMPERNIFEEQLRRAMSSPKTTQAQMVALRMFAEMKGWIIKGTQAGKKKSAVSTAAANDITSQPAYARVPVGCAPLVDGAGIIRGYQQPDGKKFRLADVEVTR